jgi:small conductance mechanosensitive channel
MLIDINKTIRLLIEKLQMWFDATILIMPNLVLAIIIFMLFVGMAGLSKKIIDKLLANVRTAENVKGIVKSLVTIVIYLAGAFSALEVLGLDKTVTSILAGAGLIGLAISLAFQNIAANVISGVIISFKHPFMVGDYIQCSDNVFGRVSKINIPNTMLFNDEGQFITVPNKDIWEKNIVNFSKLGFREIELKVGVSFDADLESVLEVSRKAIEALPFLAKRDEIDIFFQNLDTYSIELSINFWIKFKESKDFEQAKSDAIIAIVTSFRQNNIEIPMPIRSIVSRTKPV